MKKILCILTAAALCCGIPFPRLHATATEGSCGEHAAWNYQDGTLTVTGTGAMTDYPDPARLKDSADQQRVPWYDCTAEIRSVVIGEGITHVGDYAFTRTAALETVTLPDSLISLGNNAFSCSALPEVTLPAHLETLGNSCFLQGKMTKIEFPASVTELGAFCFSNSGLTELTLPDNIKSVGKCCFSSSRELTSVTLPDTDIQLGTHVFDSCDHLENVHLPETMKELPDQTFYACAALETITIPSACTVIGEEAFMDCIALTTVNMNDACTALQDSCFRNCILLKSVSLPDTVQTIGDNAFRKSALKEIKLSKDLISLGKNCFDNSRLASVTLPEGLTEIGECCFAGTMISEIVIPESVRFIGRECFTDCSNMNSAVFADTDIRIEDRLFFLCYSLGYVHLPETLEQIPDEMFFRCSDLKTVNIPESCMRIGAKTFYGCESLAEITLPEHCREIGESCFWNCYSLGSIELPEVCSSLGDYCFKDCSKLKSFRMPDSITEVNPGILINCSSLTELELSHSLTEFSFSAISGTTSLKSLVIPENVQKITYDYSDGTPDYSTNYGLTNLTLPQRSDLEIMPHSIPRSVLDATEGPLIYGDGILYCWCGSERDITIPDNVKAIHSYAFGRDIEYLTIPPSVKEIDSYALIETFNVKAIRGACLSAAHAYAVEHYIDFEPTEPAPAPEGKPAPYYDSSNLPFGNSGSVFGEIYDITNWQRRLLFSYAPSQTRMEKKMAEAWQGSCYGLSAVTVLVSRGELPLSALDPEAKTMHDVRPTEDCIRLINYYQMTSDIANTKMNMGAEFSPRKILNTIRLAEQANKEGKPFLISFSAPGGEHAVVGYGLEAGSWTFNENQYDFRVPIWDSNYAEPNDNAALYISSTDLSYTIPAYSLTSDEYNSKYGLSFVVGSPEILNCAPYREPELATGDLDGSGEPEIADAMKVLCAYTDDMAGILDTLTLDQKYAADVNKDETVSVEDAQLILKFYTEKTVAGKQITWEDLLK